MDDIGNISNRHQFRADWHDYDSGIYFITICSYRRQHLFGEIDKGVMACTPLGEIVNDCIKSIPSHHPAVEIWNHTVMPNHIHMVVNVGARYIAPAPQSATTRGCLKPPMHSEECSDYHHNSRLAVIVGTLKAAITRMARARCIAPLTAKIWQRLYHEHIIRNQQAFERIMAYVDDNVISWSNDCFNKANSTV